MCLRSALVELLWATRWSLRAHLPPKKKIQLWRCVLQRKVPDSPVLHACHSIITWPAGRPTKAYIYWDRVWAVILETAGRASLTRRDRLKTNPLQYGTERKNMFAISSREPPRRKDDASEQIPNDTHISKVNGQMKRKSPALESKTLQYTTRHHLKSVSQNQRRKLPVHWLETLNADFT